jgi:hypothetical protein
MSQQQSLEDAADMMGGNIRTRRDRIAGETFIADVNASTTLSLQLFKKNVLRCICRAVLVTRYGSSLERLFLEVGVRVESLHALPPNYILCKETIMQPG